MDSPVIREIEKALSIYNKKRQTLISNAEDKKFFEALKPTAIGWKVADQAKYQKIYQELRESSDFIVETWMNERWIAKIHLKDRPLSNGVKIIKIMQIRPGSEDPLGLDHIDFYYSKDIDAKAVLTTENIKWSQESNDILSGYQWLSVWFEDTEAKLKAGTVLDTIGEQFKQLNKSIIPEPSANL